MRQRNKTKFAIAIFILLLFTTQNTFGSEEDDTQITVFCTNNKDGTGSCLTSSQESVDCILIPGSVVECSDKEKNQLACVSVHSTTAIVEISCETPKPIIRETNTTEILSGSKELNLSSGDKNKSINADQYETSPTEDMEDVASPDQPPVEDAGESPFADPF